MRPPPANHPSAPAKLRCAIYTRKSTEEGLEQAFNSLHAQREACEAYILSQAGEGWIGLKTIYDDGGYSGGNADRPALKRLLADVADHKVDVVVVYKVDRLTRSLADFVKIVEIFDAAGASFVSITQAFNTTSSMGRLTLNVLLSFAQFEREVTGERIRDKIAQSKAKGMWMGGVVPLGYAAKDRTLIVEPIGAEQVRGLFRRYLELRSVPALKAELDAAGARSRAWVTRRGLVRGGASFSCGALFHLLRNPLYIGRIVHKGEVHQGLHPPILDQDLFDAVQACLDANGLVRNSRPTRAAKSPLTGRIFDADGGPMSPSFGYGQQKRLYRYYVSASVLPGRAHTAKSKTAVRRVPAPPIEALVMDRIKRLSRSSNLDWPEALRLIERVELQEAAVHIVATTTHTSATEIAEAAKGDQIQFEGRGRARRVRIIVPGRPVFRGGRTWCVNAEGTGSRAPKPSPTLIRGLRQAHAALAALESSPLTERASQAQGRAPDEFQVRRTAPLAFLAPDIQRAILDGRQPPGLTMLGMLADGIPLLWSEQRRVFGFEA